MGRIVGDGASAHTRLRLPPALTFTTDFGTRDSYVAEMKAAALRTLPPGTPIVDVTHEVGAQDVLAASFALERALRAFWPGCAHVCVVDPAVGTERRLLVVSVAGQFVVCPDSGVVTWPWRRLGKAMAHELKWRPTALSYTFHGRDVMAPAAAALLAGTPLDDLAVPLAEGDLPALLDVKPTGLGERRGRVVHVDRFGNCTTNVPAEHLPPVVRQVQAVMRAVGPLRNTYADVAVGQPLALVGSSGLLEIAVRNGSAAEQLQLSVGSAVEVR